MDLDLHKWLRNRWLSLYDATFMIEDRVIAECLDEFLETHDTQCIDTSVVAFDRLLDAIDAGIAQRGDDIDLLIQLRDDLTYFPPDIASQL